MSEIIEKIKKIRNTLPTHVQLIAATKDQSIEKLEEAMKCGLNSFGENYVQEFLSKWEAIRNKAQWHFIGHLQTNKVKVIVDKVSMIQTVDSLKLFETIHKEAQKINRKIPILLEINIGEEKTKSGIIPSELSSFMTSPPKNSNVEICGFMTIPPYAEDLEEVRPYFKKMMQLQKEMQDQFPNLNLKELSMGMTHDYTVAIEEGATIVRIGEGIFGKRKK